MDPIIGKYPCKIDGELAVCDGLAYQLDMTVKCEYGEQYFQNYVERETSLVAPALNLVRTTLTEKYCLFVLDVGIGSGMFIKEYPYKAYGYDINPFGVAWLKERSLYLNPWEGIPSYITGVTLWDTLEHMPEPTAFLNLIPKGVHVLVSLPIFDKLDKIRESKHYKPGEHLLYFSKYGLISYMRDASFDLLAMNNDESRVGRENVWSFVFQKI